MERRVQAARALADDDADDDGDGGKSAAAAKRPSGCRVECQRRRCCWAQLAVAVVAVLVGVFAFR